jgi:hypothetical protein
MGRPRKPQNAMEEKFLAIVEEHGDEIEAAFKAACSVADKYGIPFGTYVPTKFKSFLTRYDYKTDTEIEGVDTDWVGQICDVDQEFWQSSTTYCEIFHG